MDLKAIKGVGPATAEKLENAGIESVEELESADVEALSNETGLSEKRLRRFVERAKDLTEDAAGDASKTKEAATKAKAAAGEVEDAAKRAISTVSDRAEEFKVVLRDQAQTARVKLGDTWHNEVPIVTAKLQESEDRILEGLRHNAVLLKEKATTAYVKIGDTWHEGVPIFKQRPAEDGDGEETRVQVSEIRKKREASDEGFLGKIRSLFSK